MDEPQPMGQPTPTAGGPPTGPSGWRPGAGCLIAALFAVFFAAGVAMFIAVALNGGQ